MLRSLFKSLILARQASAAYQMLDHMSDRQLEDIGYSRSTFVEAIKNQVFEELSAQKDNKAASKPVNPNLVGAV